MDDQKPKPQWSPVRRIENQFEADLLRILTGYFQTPEEARLLTFTDWLDAWSLQAASRMITGLAVQNAKSWRDASKQSMHGGIIHRALINELSGPTGKRIKQLVLQNAQLIRTLPLDVSEQVTRYIEKRAFAGERATTIRGEIAKYTGHVARWKSQLIARTEVSKASTALTQARSENLNLNWYVWRSSQDGRVRRSHRFMASRGGVLVSWSDPASPELLVGERDYGHYAPGNIFNCFPGSTEANLANGCDKLWRRRFKGTLTEVVLSDGTVLQSTPNHPVLARSGWLAMDRLKQGDHLFQSMPKTVNVANDQNDRLKSRFDYLFESMRADIGSESAMGSELDFHGDGSEDDIDVVDVNGFLRNYFVAVLQQTFMQFMFARSGQPVPSTLSGLGFKGEADGRVRLSHRGISVRNQFAALRNRHFSHADRISFTDRAAMYATAGQDFRNCSTAASHGASDSLFALSGEVSADDGIATDQALLRANDVAFNENSVSDEGVAESARLAWDELRGGAKRHPLFDKLLQVTSTRKVDFDGHVYGLQSDNGWYRVTSANIITKNCRCYPEPLLRFDQVRWPHPVYMSGAVRMMTLAAFRQIAGADRGAARLGMVA